MQIMFRCFQNVLLVIALTGLFFSSWGSCTTFSNYLWRGSQCGKNAVDYINFANPTPCTPAPIDCDGYSSDIVWGGTLNSNRHIYSVDCHRTSYLPQVTIGYCDTQSEADSVACVNSGSNWINGQCKNCDASDPSSWKCETTSSIVKAQESSPDIICDASFGGCYSGNACAIYTEYQTSCVNECTGDSTVESYRTDPVWQDGFCDEVDIDRDDCGKTRCVDMDGNFALVHDCNSNNIVNGVPQTFPVVIQGGKGSCASNGYQPINPDSLNNNGNSSNRDSILKALQDSLYSQNCLFFGQCGNTNDSTDFTDNSNRNAENGCYCERMDDMPYVSRIICPDGTSSIFYGSCNDWQNKSVSSSSNPSSSDSQSSESGGGGSSEADSRPTDWANWSQANEMNKKLDANNGLLASISDKLSNIFSFLSGGGGSLSDGKLDSLSWNTPSFVDSSFVYDTTQVSIFGDVQDSLFNLARSNQGLIDTSQIAKENTCFSCRLPLKILGYSETFTFDFGNVGGFDLCKISRAIVVALVEIACLMMFILVFVKK